MGEWMVAFGVHSPTLLNSPVGRTQLRIRLVKVYISSAVVQ